MVDLTLDTDNDGVFDLIDLDDDNDGLVDENEGAITSRYQVLDDQLYVFNATTGDLDPIGVPTNFEYNALAYDAGTVDDGSDDIMYAIAREDGTDSSGISVTEGDLIEVDHVTGEVSRIAAITITDTDGNTEPVGRSSFSGDFVDGNYVISAGPDKALFEVDPVTGAGVQIPGSDNFRVSDFVELNGVYYGVQSGELYRFDSTATDPDVTITPLDGIDIPEGSFGSAWVIDNDQLVFLNNGGGFYEVIDYDTDTPELIFITDAAPANRNDGAGDSTKGFVFGPDTDGDGIEDRLDLDSDNDGISDLEESGVDVSVLDPDGNGVIDGAAFVDHDGDGLADAIEAANGEDTGTTLRDTDGDGVADMYDLDSDNDGISDLEEGGADTATLDTNNDGTIDLSTFTDLDGNGIDDTVEATSLPTIDTDLDGTADYIDIDSDNDGISDFIEAQPTSGYEGTDGDVTNDDADGDGVLDIFETGNTDDGIFGGAFETPENTDGTGLADYRDLDSDDDNILDEDESGLDNTGPDHNFDGISDTAPGTNTDPSGGINDPLNELQNEDGDASDADYRTLAPNADPVDGNEADTFVEGSTTPVAVDALIGATDPDGDPVTLDPSFTLTDDGPGTASIDAATGEVIYTPDGSEQDGDVITITYQVTDGNGGTDTSTVTLTVHPAANQDPVDGNEADTFVEGSTTPVAVDALIGATDPDGDPVTLDPSFTLTDDGPGTASIDAATGEVIYTPDGSEQDGDVITITYQVTDGNGGTDTSTVTLTVGAPVNIDEDEEVTFVVGDITPIVIDVLEGTDDTITLDPSFTPVSDGPGTVSIDPTTGEVTYVPDGSEEPGDVISITYRVLGANGEVETSTVVLEILPVELEAEDDSGTVCADVDLTIDVLDNDAGSAPMTITSVDGQAISEGETIDVDGIDVSLVGGQLVFNGEDAFEDLTFGETGSAAMSYTVENTDGDTSTATIDLMFKGVAETIDELNASLPTTGEYQILGGDLEGEIEDDGYTLVMNGTGDDRFDGQVFENAYCLSILDPVIYAQFAEDSPTSTGQISGSDDTSVFGADQISYANGESAADNLDLINWIINEDFSNDASGQYNDWEVQRAIWELTDGFDTSKLDAVDDNYGQDADVDAILDLAIANGEGFVAGEGDIATMIVDPGDSNADHSQPFIVAYDFDANNCDCPSEDNNTNGGLISAGTNGASGTSDGATVGAAGASGVATGDGETGSSTTTETAASEEASGSDSSSDDGGGSEAASILGLALLGLGAFAGSAVLAAAGVASFLLLSGKDSDDSSDDADDNIADLDAVSLEDIIPMTEMLSEDAAFEDAEDGEVSMLDF